jgi:hypothetical protein
VGLKAVSSQCSVRCRVLKRLSIVASVVALGVLVGGCSKCGFWLDEWLEQPAKSCKADLPK